MKIAYFTLLNPVRSGVSDWTEELLPYLNKHMEIDIYVDALEPENQDIGRSFAIYDIKEYEENIENMRYDLRIFQAGNSSYHNRIMDAFMIYGGILELHDISMHHYWAARTFGKGDWNAYLRVMKACHGIKGERVAKAFKRGECKAPWEQDALTFTVTREYIEKAQAIIVHSDFARQMVKGIDPYKKVAVIPLHTQVLDQADADRYRRECRKHLGISEDIIVFGSYGLITPTKRIDVILRTLDRFRIISKRKFHYYIAGENHIAGLENTIKDLGLEECVTITGRLSLDAFRQYMGACDIAFNLRYPTQGESSASLHRLIGYGKVTIVSDIGSFEEYPNEFVLKVRHDMHEETDLLNFICQLVYGKKKLEAYEKKAILYARENFDITMNARKYFDFFNGIINDNISVEYVEGLVDAMDIYHISLDRIFT